MNDLIRGLLRIAAAGTPDEAEVALMQLSLVLEKNSRWRNQAAIYAEMLPPDLCEVVLSTQQREEVLLQLKQLRAGRTALDPAILGCIGAVGTDASLLLLSGVAADTSLSQVALRQAIAEIDRGLPADHIGNESLLDQLAARGLEEVVERVLRDGPPTGLAPAQRLRVRMRERRTRLGS